MADDPVRSSIRAALDAAIAVETKRIEKQWSESAASVARTVEMMRPIITALRALEEETRGSEGLKFSIDGAGSRAQIKIGDFKTVSIGADCNNASFRLTTDERYPWDEDIPESAVRNYTDPTELLKDIVQAVAGHMALRQVVAGLRAKKPDAE